MRTEHTALAWARQAEVHAEPKTFPWSLGPQFPHLNQCPQMTEDEMIGWHGITNSVDMSLSKLQEIVKRREAWQAAVLGITKSPWGHMTEQLDNYNLKQLTAVRAEHLEKPKDIKKITHSSPISIFLFPSILHN